MTTGTVDLASAAAPQSSLLARSSERPVILTDLTVTPFDAGSVRSIVGALVDSCDAVLVGEHQNRPDFPPALMSTLIAGAGLPAWVTLSCRDRNRLVLEQEIAALRYARVDGVLAVTGDGRAQGIRPDVTQVFDLDGTRLAAMSAAAGLVVAVAESPGAAPVALRPARLLEKQRAGASVCILNHVASRDELSQFLRRAHALGVRIPVIASVAVYTDDRSAAVLQNFPGFDLDPRTVGTVLAAADPVSAGVAAAAEEARGLLALDGVVGVNISGLASARGIAFATEVKAEVGRAIQQDLS